MQHIAIVGGGFSGSLAAVNLSRLGVGPLKISLINSGFPLGRGIAYSTHNGNHLLNVAARNMSALADQPSHFVEWLGTRSEYREEPEERLREMFVPRRIYGDYVSGLLFSQSAWAAEKGIVIETVHAEAADIVPSPNGARVMLTTGESIEATKVVLATGNSAPAFLRLTGLDPMHAKCFQNPWNGWEDKMADPSENVILIGTGLTAVDVFISLKDLNWKGKLFAISRNGLLPLSHFKGMEYPAWLDATSQRVSLANAFKLFKNHYRKALVQGVNPAILVDKLRPMTQHLWQCFSLPEKRRFNRHFRTRWNVVRHRIAQSIHQQLMEAIASSRLEIIKGRLCGAFERGDRVVVAVNTGHAVREIEGVVIINCTGPSESYLRSQSLLYRNLFSRGLIKADGLDMGIQATPDFAVVGADGESSRFLFALGPMLKGSLWESTAVPELRSQAFRVAQTLAEQLYGKRTPKLAEAVEVVHEYEI